MLRGGDGKRFPLTIASSIELRLRCLAPRLHDLGEGPLFYLLRELAAGGDLLTTVEAYARLPHLIRTYGGDRLSPALTVFWGQSS